MQSSKIDASPQISQFKVGNSLTTQKNKGLKGSDQNGFAIRRVSRMLPP
jgi:hypothetical protein